MEKHWCELPEDILTEVFRYLGLADRFRASLVCHKWSELFQSPHIWTHTELCFDSSAHCNTARLVDLVKKHGRYIRALSLLIDQGDAKNREHACMAILELARCRGRRLQRLKVRFISENPCLYNGQEFLDCLNALFCPPLTSPEDLNNHADDAAVSGNLATEVSDIENTEDDDDDVEGVRAAGAATQLLHVDLSGLKVNLEGQLMCILSYNNPQLRTLDIQNRVLVCKVHPGHMLQLVERCRMLTELKLYSCSNSEELLISLTKPDRVPLQHLSIVHRREDKCVRSISAEVWATVVHHLPALRITLGFDSTCPLNKVGESMCPGIPVTVLRLETYTDLIDEIRLATQYYKNCLEKLILNTPGSRHSRDLDDALIDLAKNCNKLRSLHVFCVLNRDTVDQILALRPVLQDRGAYTLKYEPEPHPWTPGKDYWP